MTPIDRYRIEKHEGDYTTWPGKSRLWADDQLLPEPVSGYVIEGQYDTPLGSLLITSYDCMYEEANSFLLIEPSGRVRAQADLGVPYGSFLLHAHWPVDESTLALHYHGDQFYTLSVRPGRWWELGQVRLALEPCADWQGDARMAASARQVARKLVPHASN